MSTPIEHVDYHVGILRGFLLATKADPQVLHALSVILTNYRSKAGDSIGHDPIEPTKHYHNSDVQFFTEAKPNVTIPSKHNSDSPPKDLAIGAKTKVFWTTEDDATLERMYCEEGIKPVKIAQYLNRSKQSISNRIYAKGLKRSSLQSKALSQFGNTHAETGHDS